MKSRSAEVFLINHLRHYYLTPRRQTTVFLINVDAWIEEFLERGQIVVQEKNTTLQQGVDYLLF